MNTLVWALLLLTGAGALAYLRVSLKTATIAVAATLLMSLLVGGPLTWLLVIATIIMVPLNIDSLRKSVITSPVLGIFRKILPEMSSTEREALEAGTVWWEGELFTGKPDWSKLTNAAPPQLSDEEQAFLDGPCEELCQMIDEWTFNYEYGDMPQEVYDFINKHGFLGMIIPKRYGGLGFSAAAQIMVVNKIMAVSMMMGNYISVPNSLGPGELLVKYGTEEQKDHYLPRLAKGEDVPCFGLTSPRAGSDAGSIPDTGHVCMGEWEGQQVLGMRMNFSKRYITLAPIATVIGLAFKLYDPENLLGEGVEDYGITCALLPRSTPGLDIGRRHFPMGSAFMNGVIKGKDIFVPIDYIIGGPSQAGKGWRMLVECLSVGRCISLPCGAMSGAKRSVAATTAYARIRRQFNLPIGKFEAIAHNIGRMSGLTYIIDAMVRTTGAAIDAGEEPSVPSAILKYHSTEMARVVTNDAMDVQGGKAVIQGPKNYLSANYGVLPIAVTVEGANILTRSLIIFGQGAVRCHPFVLREMRATRMEDQEAALNEFDSAFFGHVGFAISNAARSFFMGLTGARLTSVPGDKHTKRYYQKLSRYSAAFALASDVSMLSLGGSLKFRETLSARLGDMLSYIYMASMVLKSHENKGSPKEDLPLLTWSCDYLFAEFEKATHELLQNFPVRPVAWTLRALIFPWGRTEKQPDDKTSFKVARLMTNQTDARDRVLEGAFLTPGKLNTVGRLNAVLKVVDELDPIENKFAKAVKSGKIKHVFDMKQLIDDAQAADVLTAEEAQKLKDYDDLIMDFIHVDDFDFDDIGRNPLVRTDYGNGGVNSQAKRGQSGQSKSSGTKSRSRKLADKATEATTTDTDEAA